MPRRCGSDERSAIGQYYFHLGHYRQARELLEQVFETPLEVDIRFAVPLDQMAAVSPGYTAHRAVNAIPFVCAAAPGIRSSVELPQIVAALS